MEYIPKKAGKSGINSIIIKKMLVYQIKMEYTPKKAGKSGVGDVFSV
jgi:hypothetical protein